MMQYIDSIQSAMLSAGINPPPDIYLDSRIHRFDVDKPGDKAGWYCFHADNIPAGSYGNWKTGQSETWCSKDALTRSEHEEFIRIVNITRKQRDKQKQADQKKAEKKAQSIWQNCHVATDHPYLKRKGINPNGAKVNFSGALVIPVMVEGEITSLQFIHPDGSKKFLSGGKVKGGYFHIGDLIKPDIAYICEGFASGATVYEETGNPVFCAFNAKNLTPVANSVRANYPDAAIIIAGDNDHATQGNPGITEAKKAAAAVEGAWTVPIFTGLDYTSKDTDFNDLRRLTGGFDV